MEVGTRWLIMLKSISIQNCMSFPCVKSVFKINQYLEENKCNEYLTFPYFGLVLVPHLQMNNSQ